MQPIFKFEQQKIVQISSLTTLDKIAKFGFYISIIPFIEQIFLGYHLIFSSGNIETAIMSAYEDATLDQLSFVTRNLLRINIAVYDLSFLILLTCLIRPQKDKKILLFVLFIIITRNLTGIIMASRGAMVNMGLRFILVYVISFPFLEAKFKKQFNKYILILSTIFGAIFAIITLGRQIMYSETVNDEFTMTYFLSRYMGESLINFNQYLPLMKETSGGEHCFWSIMDYLGMQPHEWTTEYMYGALMSKMGIPQNVFYTFIGDFVQDLGFIGAFIWLSFVAIIFTNIIHINKNIIKLSTMFSLLFYANIVINGVISYSYSGTHGKFVIWNILIYIILYLKKI